MDVVLKQAEERLVSTLKRVQVSTGNKYCLQIGASVFSAEKFVTLPSLICKWIGQDCMILVCHDKNVFVFSDSLSPRILELFREHFYPHFNIDPLAHPGLISFYDIETSAGLIELAETRLRKELDRRKVMDDREKAATKERLKAEILAMPLNADLLRTLSSRRMERGSIEILVVEDDPFSRRLLDMALRQDFDISFAESGAKGIVSYLHRAPDIVFLDIDLPDVSGHDVLGKILEIDSGACVVMLSGNGNAENVRNAIRAGASGFVGKPFTKDKLLQYIRKCPRNQQKRAEV